MGRTNPIEHLSVGYYCTRCGWLAVLVDLVGIEPTTSSMPWKRAPSCATGPLLKHQRLYEGVKQINSRLLAIDSQTLGPSAASLNFVTPSILRKPGNLVC